MISSFESGMVWCVGCLVLLVLDVGIGEGRGINAPSSFNSSIDPPGLQNSAESGFCLSTNEVNFFYNWFSGYLKVRPIEAVNMSYENIEGIISLNNWLIH